MADPIEPGLFLQSGICRACGAYVALTDVHQRWHEDLAKTFGTHVKTFEKIIEAAGLRPRRSSNRAATKAADGG
ncbi:hypothetical protein [Nocardia sp. NPDC055049]